MKVLITGANGFLGKNLRQHLSELRDIEVLTFTREDNLTSIPALLKNVDFVFHLAGINRPEDLSEFYLGNTHLTEVLSNAIANEVKNTGRKIGVVFTSSTQAKLNNDYGQSKKASEEILLNLKLTKNIYLYIFRLPNIFGKWSKPNYNSVVSTFCHNIAYDYPIKINDPNEQITLVYVDDVIEHFIVLMNNFFKKPINIRPVPQESTQSFYSVTKEFKVTLKELAESLQFFKNSRNSLLTERVGTGFLRALYATYISYLPINSFSYRLPSHADQRGAFTEFIKTLDSGQISIFTANQGHARGSHYHHSKTEKFLVVKGEAKFKFKHVQTGETHEIVVSSDKPEVIETIPGWAHEIQNIGIDSMVVVLWSNEIFDPTYPDTFSYDL